MRYSNDRNIHDMIRRLVAIGWAYRRGTKHGQLYAPGAARQITIPGSPGDRRSYLNLRADIRRAAPKMPVQ